jgi:predicted lipoprotein with Yx(FWY)xxD motif
VSAVGAAEWARDGISVCTAPQDQFSQQIMPDGVGGAVIAWMDSRGGNNNIFSQRARPDGRMLWAADGVAVCFERHDQRYPQIASDGARGAIVTWIDFRATRYDIYAQRVGAGGANRWTPNGVPISSRAQGRETR